MPDVSVIIVNFRGWQRLRLCLDSLSAIPQNHFAYEVIIVDNASKDGVLEEFKKQYRGFLFIENTGNNGFANGCNLGAFYASGEQLLFLNPDTVISEQAIEVMLQKIRASNKSTIVSCKQIKENGSEEKSYGIFLSPLTLTGWLRGLNKLLSGPIENRFTQDAESINPDWVSGSVIMISITSLNSLGRWDEDFWMYYEDADLCKRLRNAGGEVIFLKNVVVEHNHGGATRINPSITALTKTEVLISRHIYIAKHSKGIECAFIQSFLIINNVIIGAISAFLGVLFFYNGKLKIYSLIWLSLIKYYFNALINRTWLSHRSVNYRK